MWSNLGEHITLRSLICETVKCSTDYFFFFFFKSKEKWKKKVGSIIKKMEDHADSEEPKIKSNLTLHGDIFLLRHSQAQTGYSTEYSSQNSGLVGNKNL